MKKRNSFAILIAGAAVLGLASCGTAEPEKEQEQEQQHQHVFSELHAKVDPTCTADGHEAYYSCEGCPQLFNEDKEVISQIVTLPATGHVPHEHAAVEATCTEDGHLKYWTCDNESADVLYKDENCSQVISSIPVDPMSGHSYGKPSVEWNGKSATATATCTKCPDQISETKDGDFVEDAAATCHSEQLGHYEVKFDDERLGSAETKENSVTGSPATGKHVYGTPSVEWNGKSATATAECTAEGCSDKITETKDGEFTEDTAVSCCADQLGHYEVKFDDERLGSASTEAKGIKGESATGNHNFDYANKTITWNGDVATATAKCSNSACEAVASETKKGTFASDTDSTCTAPEKGHYEVTFDNTNFGSAQTEANSVDNGEPHAHTFGTLIPEVPALRGAAGTKAHYKCSECDGYFNSSYESVTASDLTIAAPAKHFDANTDMNFDFGAPIPLTETITIDVKLENPTSESKVNFALFGLKDGGGSDWDNYLGYFAVRKAGSDNYAGISTETITDDGYFRIKIDLSQVNKVNNENDKTPSFSAINGLYVRGGWTDVSGYIEVNSAVNAHTKGETLIPAKAAGPHGADGYQAHYECTGCDDYWFNESGALCKKEDLIIASKAIKYAPPASGNTLAEFKNLGNITDKVSVDIHFDNPTKHQEVGFNFYESAWDNYYGTFWVDCDEKGVYFEGDYEGLTLDELTDGWWRVTAYPSVLTNFRKDKADIDQKHSIDFIYIKGPNNVSNRGSGMFELNSAFEGTVPSTKVYSFSGEKYAIDRTFLKGDIINLDVKIKNETKINLALLSGWDSILTFNVKPDGKLEDQKNGVQVFKLNNELAGYPTLEGTWYRVIIDTNYISSATAFTAINRIGGNRWNGAEYDMMINSPYTIDGWYTIAGGSSNTKIEFKIPTPLEIRDGDGQLFNKALYFEVKAVGSGKAYVSPMDYDWHNCGKYVLTFTDGALTDRVVQGSANKWPKVTDLGNGVYGLTLALSQLPGDGLASASSIGFFYNGDGVLADGLSEFSINVLSLKLVEIPA